MERGRARCVCGRSATLPLCDGSHREAGWRCADAAPFVEACVVGGHHLRPLAERLAHRAQGVAAHRVAGPLRARRVVVLSDGTDLDELAVEVARIEAAERLAVAVDVPAAGLARLLPGWPVREVTADDPLRLWSIVSRDGPAEVPRAGLARGFLSHAVVDEDVVVPAADWLRRHAGAELFVCGDSIAPGEAWRTQIHDALARAEVFVLVSSAAASRSTWCAFEAGWAMARDLPFRVVVLDGSPPPPFVADVQAADLHRTCRARPWLTHREALLEALLRALARPGG